MSKSIIIIALILSFKIAQSQVIQTPSPNLETKRIYLGDILKNAALSEQEFIEISNSVLVTRGVNDNIKDYILSTANRNGLHFSKDSLIEIKPKVVFTKCRFIADDELTMAAQGVRLNGFSFGGGLSINQSEFEFSTLDISGEFDSFEFFSNKNLDLLNLSKSIFKSTVSIWNHLGKTILISHCNFNGRLAIDATIDQVHLSESTFNLFEANPCYNYEKDSLYNLLSKTSFFVEGKGQELLLKKNTFLGGHAEIKIHISGNWESIELVKNKINSLMTFNSAKVESKFELIDNIIDGKISFNGLVFPEKYNLLRWKQFSGKKIVLFEI